MHDSRRHPAPTPLAVRPGSPVLAASSRPSTGLMLAQLRDRVGAARPYNIGFPAAVDVDWSPLSTLLTGGLLNNVGGPDDESVYACHTKPMEREVVRTLAKLFRAPPAHSSGHVADGATSATLWSLHQSRKRYPRAVVYHSQAAHHSVPKAASLLGMPAVTVRADDTDEIDYEDLRRHVAANPEFDVVVVANIGTTMTEAHDDIRRIAAIVDDLGVRDRWIYADAALSGIPLALIDPDLRGQMAGVSRSQEAAT